MGDFQNLGWDILGLLFTLLPVKDVLALGTTSKAMNALSKMPRVWRKLLLRDFGLIEAGEPFTVYVEQYGFELRHGGECSHRPSNCLAYAASQGFLNDVKAAIRRGMDPAANDNCAIRRAARNGHVAIITLLLSDKRVDPSARDNYAVRWAAGYGHAEVVRLLLADERVDPADDDNDAIHSATEDGHTEVVKLLLADKRVDPAADDNWIICWAASCGRTEVVKLLLTDKRVDPSARNNRAIWWAAENGHADIVELLRAHKKARVFFQ